MTRTLASPLATVALAAACGNNEPTSHVAIAPGVDSATAGETQVGSSDGGGQALDGATRSPDGDVHDGGDLEVRQGSGHGQLHLQMPGGGRSAQRGHLPGRPVVAVVSAAPQRLGWLWLASAAALTACSGANEGDNAATAVAGAVADGGTLGADGSSDAGEPNKPAPAVRLVYAATRGVTTPHFIPISGASVGEPIQLGPRRGAGYGMGEGAVSYPDLTPDGTQVVVAFYPLHTVSASFGNAAHLFALPIDGVGTATPTKIAIAPQLHATKRVYGPGVMAYVDGRKLFIAHLDGSDLAAPILIAQVDEGMEISAVRWVAEGDELAWPVRSTSGGSAAMYVGAADGSELANPRKQMTGNGPAEFIAAVLPDGRVVARGGDDRLYAISTTAAFAPVVLTPSGLIADALGTSADGKRLAVVLRTTWQKERQLVSVATDGSEADDPVMLAPAPVNKLAAILSRDGSAVAWTGLGSNGQWAAYQAPIGGLAPGADPRLSTWSMKPLHVTDFRANAEALVGGSDDGAALRFLLGSATPQAPVVLAKVEDVVNHSNPWPVLSVDGKQVSWHANTTTGWHAWTVPLTGGTAKLLPGPWYWDLLTPHGILYGEYVHEEAVFVTDLAGQHVQLSPWHDGPLHGAHLLPGGHHVAWHASAPKAGWYAAATAVAQTSAEPPAVLVMPDVAGPAGSKAATTRPLATASHLVRMVDGQVQSFALDGSNATQPIVLGFGAAGAGGTIVNVAAGVVVDPDAGRAAFFSLLKGGKPAAKVVSARVDGSDGDAPVPIMNLSHPVDGLGLLPGSGRVLAIGHGAQGSSLSAAAMDGSEVTAPLLLASGLPGWFMAAVPTTSGAHVLTVHSIEATAVPHPDLLLATPATAAAAVPDQAAYAIAPANYYLWQGPDWMGATSAEEASNLASSADGKHIVLRGPDGLYSARSDGSQAAAPVLLGSAKETIGPPLSPDGTRLALRQQGALVVSTIGVGGSQTALTDPNLHTVASARWAADGARVVYLAGPLPKQAKYGRLHVVATDGSSPALALHSADFAAAALLGIVPGADVALVESPGGGDHSLYAVALDGSGGGKAPKALTPIDDVGERFVGFVAAEVGD